MYIRALTKPFSFQGLRSVRIDGIPNPFLVVSLRACSSDIFCTVAPPATGVLFGLAAMWTAFHYWFRQLDARAITSSQFPNEWFGDNRSVCLHQGETR